ncbi:MAG: SUMF1/EgtB/PvdO family nonheme iron enzyme [Bacteroidota bacterium]
MILIAGGGVEIGSEEGGENEKPVFKTYINPFYLDEDLIKVSEFRLFIKITRYITDAQKKGQAQVTDSLGQKKMVAGAYWAYPKGPTRRKAKDEDPVTQISWNDAQAYARWLGKRLPSEFEIEYVAKNNTNPEVKNLKEDFWQWSFNWYTDYNQSTYYDLKLNRKKSLKGGKTDDGSFRPSARLSLSPDESTDKTSFRCAKDIR